MAILEPAAEPRRCERGSGVLFPLRLEPGSHLCGGELERRRLPPPSGSPPSRASWRRTAGEFRNDYSKFLRGGALPPFHGLGSVGVRRAFEWRPPLCCSLWRASVRSPSLLRDENNAASQAAKLGTHCGFPEPAFHQRIELRVEGGVLRPPAGLCCCFDTIEEAAPSLFTSTAMSTENNLFPVCF